MYLRFSGRVLTELEKKRRPTVVPLIRKQGNTCNDPRCLLMLEKPENNWHVFQAGFSHWSANA